MEKGPNEMDLETETQSTPPQSRARTNSKLRVLGRSDAMREETSPPRDPPQSSPSIKLIPSANSSPNECTTPTLCNPLVVLSPSRSRGSSPCRGSTISSPTSTLVPSPKCRSSPQNVSPNFLEHSDVCCIQHMNAQDGGCYDRRCHDSNLHTCQKTIHNREESTCYCKCDETSQIKTSSRRILRMERVECDSLKSCNKCLMNREKNINNNINSINNNFNNSNNLSVHKSARGKLRQQSSSQGSSSNSPCLSRDSSSEYQYTDSSGTHLEHFIIETINRNSRDRALMLRIETELVNLAKHPTQSRCTFPPMSSYERMCIHRVAAYFGMDHNVDATGRSVIVSKSSNTRVPVNPFASYFDEEMQRKILRRPDSMEEYSFKPLDRQSSLENRRSKSFEEREEDYNKARKRIFDREMHEFSSNEEFGWSEVPWSSTDSDNSSRFRLLHPERHTGRLLKNGKPVKNVDGTIYHYDPSNPPDIIGSVNMPNSNMDKSNSEEEDTKNACSLSSPKKVRPKSSPTSNKKHNFINTSTSPSLPLVPSTQSSRNSFSAPSDTASSPQYSSGYGNPSLEGPVPFHYQPSPPCFVYASYGVPGPSQYDGRLEPQIPEVPGYFVNESAGTPTHGSQYWNQQPVMYYPNGTPPTFPPTGIPPPRLPVSVGPSNSFMPPAFPPPNFAHSSQSVPNIPHPPQHNPEYVPIFSSQPVSLIYQQPPHQSQGNAMMYPGPGIICAQSPIYHSVMVPYSNLPQNVTYPQNPPTPGSANPSPFCPPNQDQLTHSMGQLSIGPNQTIPFNHTMPPPPIPQQFDPKNQRSSKGNKFGYSKSLVSCSSQSSTGTNSPATTIISSNPNFVQYRTPPETPPAINNAFSFPQNYAMFPQMGNGRMNAQMNRSSRSPTPGSEGSQIDRSRFNQSFHGMPFAGPNGDSRNFQAYRQQPPNYRPQNSNQTGEPFHNRNRKKYRGNKAPSGLPPSGK